MATPKDKLNQIINNLNEIEIAEVIDFIEEKERKKQKEDKKIKSLQGVMFDSQISDEEIEEAKKIWK